MSSSASAASNPDAATTKSPRCKQHVKTQHHIDTLKSLALERQKAKKMLKEIRAKSKVEQKKHKRLMAKAAKLSIDELQEIAEMKKARFTAPIIAKESEEHPKDGSSSDEDADSKSIKSHAGDEQKESVLCDTTPPEDPAEA